VSCDAANPVLAIFVTLCCVGRQYRPFFDKARSMPQFDMIQISPEAAAGADILEHTAGTPVREGGGDETYRCGGCKTKLLVNVGHHDAHGVVVKCGKCGRFNTEPHHHH
jgi:hypothetical protein